MVPAGNADVIGSGGNALIGSFIIYSTNTHWDPIMGQELLMLSLLRTRNFREFTSYNTKSVFRQHTGRAGENEQREKVTFSRVMNRATGGRDR